MQHEKIDKKKHWLETSENCVSAKKTFIGHLKVFPKLGHTLEKFLNSPGVS
jgi:hypothetical protein